MKNKIELLKKLFCDVQHAKRMSESIVVRSWENQLGKAKLLDPPQPLDLPAVDQTQQQPVPFRVVKGNQIVDRVTKDFRPILTHRGVSAFAMSFTKSKFTLVTVKSGSLSNGRQMYHGGMVESL